MTQNTTITLVTGGNRGIGRETARQLAGLGQTVLLGTRDAGRGAAAAEELRAAGGDVHAIELDVTDPAGVAAAAKRVDEEYGRLDVLINNAVNFGGSWADAERYTPSTADLDVIRAVFETNVFGVLTVTNAFLPLMLRSPAPRIVNVSSGVGSLAVMSDPAGPYAGMPPAVTYPPSKTALNAMTVQYAKQFRDSALLINAADPGYTATNGNDDPNARPVAEGAAIVVRLATLPADGPSGGFFDDAGPVPW
ncbi:SDR family NAD(P)-dependent oxidoreductase [Plantactinospora sp. GCM10030261]|uniref:SDR family NAD(P)-dependent oxidoreductase n=1 Tax=Plantactinospora sp. GCM10030261 TaxID=3273420 RepID=UPI003610CF88